MGSATSAGSTPASQGDPGTQVVSSHNATRGTPGALAATSGSVRQSKLWMSILSSLPAARVVARMTSTNCSGLADMAGLSASILVSML